MKRVLIFAFCLIAFGLVAQVIYQPHRRKDFRIAVASCSTYNTTNAWDNFIEGFQTPTTGYESNIWTGIGTTSNIFPAEDSSSKNTYKPDGACNQALKVIVPTDGTETFIRGDLGAAIDLDTIQTDVYFSLYVETAPDSGESYAIYSYFTTTTPATGNALFIQNVGGVLSLIPLQTGGAAINISVGQWYVIKLSYDTAAAVNGSSITIWSNGSQIGTDAWTRAAGDMRYLFFGAPTNLEANDSGTLWFDLIEIKTN